MRWLFGLLISRLVLGAVAVVVLLATHQLRRMFEQIDLRQAEQEGRAPVSPHLLGVLTTSFTIGLVASVVIGSVLQTLLALKVRRGRRWAWIVQLVLASLALPSTFVALFLHRPTVVHTGPAIMQLLLAVAVFVLLLVGPTRRFVNAVSASRPGRPPGATRGPGFGPSPHRPGFDPDTGFGSGTSYRPAAPPPIGYPPVGQQPER